MNWDLLCLTLRFCTRGLLRIFAKGCSICLTFQSLVEAELGELHQLVCQVDLLRRHDLNLALQLLDFLNRFLLLFID